MSSVVKWFSSDMQGAPQVTNDWGVLVTMLDACLINGFNTQNPTSVTRSGSTVTLTFSGGGHGFVQHQVIVVSGAAQSEYNGEQRVTAVTGTTVTFTIAGTPTSPATGTIAVKTAALGFEKPFSGTNKAVYRSPNLDGTRMFLRVDNSLAVGWDASWAKFGKVTIADAMSDVDTFTGSQAPFNPDDPNRNHVLTGSGTSTYNGWAKWYYAKNSAENGTPTAGNRKWVLIGDDRGFYLSIAWQPATPETRAMYAFGDYNSLIDEDPYAAVLQSTLFYTTASANNSPNVESNARLFTDGFATAALLKPASGVGGYVTAYSRSVVNGGSVSGENQLTNITPLNPTGSFNLFAPSYLIQGTSSAPVDVRGLLRGAYFCLMRKPYADMQIVDVQGSSRKYMCLNYGNAGVGLVLFDITGAW